MYRILTLSLFLFVADSCRQSTANEAQGTRPPTEAEIKEYIERSEAENASLAQKEAKKNKKINALKTEMYAIESDILTKTQKIERSRRRFFSHVNQDTVVQWTLDIERGQIRINVIREELNKLGVRTSSGGVGSME